ncbi:MAG TPA: hypothetical protein PKV73_01165 [Agriterribacter sp.]|nr:hypothetical protein [Agriterribacter sp.]
MAAASHVTAGIYGTVAGAPPYTGANPFANFNQWDTPVQMSFPGAGTIFHQVSPGQRVGNTSNYIYSVIEVQATGSSPQPQSLKYASNVLFATLATNIG